MYLNECFWKKLTASAESQASCWPAIARPVTPMVVSNNTAPPPLTGGEALGLLVNTATQHSLSIGTRKCITTANTLLNDWKVRLERGLQRGDWEHFESCLLFFGGDARHLASLNTARRMLL